MTTQTARYRVQAVRPRERVVGLFDDLFRAKCAAREECMWGRAAIAEVWDREKNRALFQAYIGALGSVQERTLEIL